MTAAAALLDFFSSAVPGWSAYVETGVPSKAAGGDADAAFPYITYSIPLASHGKKVIGSVNLWHRTTSEQIMNDAATALLDAIGYGGSTIPCDGGCLWINSDNEAKPMDSGEIGIKRRYITVYVSYETTRQKG